MNNIENELLLDVQDLKVSVAEQTILKGVSLNVKAGEIHAIMGINGSGKSTFANVLAGREDYQVTSGTVKLAGQDLLDLAPEKRAAAGLFLAFQYPVELPGVLTSYFLRTACNALRAERGEETLGVREFSQLLNEKAELLQLDPSFLRRSVNEGFSGGEKKRSEILQLAVLDPKLAILDETDSGLDIDALQIVANGVNSVRASDPKKSVILITHYQRLLDYIEPDIVHVMMDGRIVHSGPKTLAHDLEARGYQWIKDQVAKESCKNA